MESAVAAIVGAREHEVERACRACSPWIHAHVLDVLEYIAAHGDQRRDDPRWLLEIAGGAADEVREWLSGDSQEQP